MHLLRTAAPTAPYNSTRGRARSPYANPTGRRSVACSQVSVPPRRSLRPSRRASSSAQGKISTPRLAAFHPPQRR